MDTPLHRETYPELADRITWLEALRIRRTAIVIRVRQTKQSAAQIKLVPTTRNKIEKRLARVDKSLQDIDDALNKLTIRLDEVFQ